MRMHDDPVAAYFIGGPEDLTKRMIAGPLGPYYFYRTFDYDQYTFRSYGEPETEATVVTRYGRYRLAFERRTSNGAYVIYEWEGGSEDV